MNKKAINYDKDLSGLKIGKLTVLNKIGIKDYCKKKVMFYLCQCECGNLKEINQLHLVRKVPTRSCGCLLKDIGKIMAKPNRRLDGKITTEYKIWQGMRQRCNNPNDSKYYLYGGKGIKVCERWDNSFDDFFQDMGKRPSLKHSLDRFPDKDGNYEPLNCRWATDMEQACNRKGIMWIEYAGLRMVKRHWAFYFGLSKGGLDSYIKKGKPFSEIYDHFMKKKNGN